MPVCYQSLLSEVPPTVADTPKTYLFLTERHLQALWLEQKYFRPLKTTEGELIEILSPGIWNADSGPDFLKAHIKIGLREYRGDIELHLREESWQQHEHDKDDRYNNVILHVSLWKPKNPCQITTKNGRVVLQTQMQDFLTIAHARIVQLIDLDLYPYKKFIGSGKCAHSLFRNLPENEIFGFLKDAAKWRLEQKLTFLKSHVNNVSQLMGAGFSMALGYKNNTEIFLNLYNWLQLHVEKGEQQLFVLGMQACGFFEEGYKKKWSDSERYQQLHALSTQIKVEDPPRFSLMLNQVRPLNHPIRRLAVLAKLLADPQTYNLFGRMERHWQHAWTYCKNKKDWTALAKDLRSLLPTYQDHYWSAHYSFETEPSNEPLSLIGEDLKNSIIINTFLPLLYESIWKRVDPKEMNAFDALYASFPASNSSKTKYLKHRLFGDSPKGSLLQKAEAEQGAFQLHRDFCIHYEASCSGCPFVKRYLDAKSQAI